MDLSNEYSGIARVARTESHLRDLLSSSDTEAMEAQRDAARLLERLPVRQTLPIECVELQGLSVTGAAHLAGLAESAVKVGVHRGLQVLAAMLRS